MTVSNPLLSDRPAIRPLEPIPVEHEGQTMIALRDASGLTDWLVMLAPAAYYLTRYMDGQHTRDEIVEASRNKHGILVDRAVLDRLLEQLEEGGVLDGPKARALLAGHDLRPAAHAGAAYPEEAQALTAFLDRLIELETASFKGDSPLLALMLPHIDLQRGAPCYSLAYQELLHYRDCFDLFVVLGISHAPTRSPFVLTHKSFDTPLGPIATDREFVDELAADLDFDPFLDEYNHFGEHSVEFQAIFLRHLFGDRARMVPVLCGSFHECLEDPRPPESLAGVSCFIERLRRCLQSRQRVLVLASVDLAHVGARFGGRPLKTEDLDELGSQDMASLERTVEGDSQGFFATLQADRGRRNYCGTSAIYTMLEALGRPRGQLHRYLQCNEPANTSTVTVATAGFYSS